MAGKKRAELEGPRSDLNITRGAGCTVSAIDGTKIESPRHKHTGTDGAFMWVFRRVFSQ